LLLFRQRFTQMNADRIAIQEPEFRSQKKKETRFGSGNKNNNDDHRS